MEMSTDGSLLVLINHSLNKSSVISHCVIRWQHLMVSYYSNHDVANIYQQQRDIMSSTLRRRRIRRRGRRRERRRNKQKLLQLRARRRNLIKMINKRRMRMMLLGNQSLRIHMLTYLRGNLAN